jgi:hypothetical protein
MATPPGERRHASRAVARSEGIADRFRALRGGTRNAEGGSSLPTGIGSLQARARRGRVLQGFPGFSRARRRVASVLRIVLCRRRRSFPERCARVNAVSEGHWDRSAGGLGEDSTPLNVQVRRIDQSGGSPRWRFGLVKSYCETSPRELLLALTLFAIDLHN